MCASETHRVGGTIVSEEGLNVKLSARLFFSETFGIDTSRHGLIFVDLFNLVHGLILNALGQGDFALNTGIVVNKVENFALL